MGNGSADTGSGDRVFGEAEKRTDLEGVGRYWLLVLRDEVLDVFIVPQPGLDRS